MDQEHRPEAATNEVMGNASYVVDDKVSLVEVINALLQRRHIFLRTLFLIAGITLVVATTRPTRYTSSASFLPETSEPSVTGALALAQQLGVSLGGGSSERRPEFYADLVTSSEILRSTVVTRYPIEDAAGERGEIDLIEYYEVNEDTKEGRIERAMERLNDDLSVATDPNTGIVGFSITTSDPLLSQGVAAQILDRVNDFDLNTRQSQAGAERLFAGDRLIQQTRELRRAEDSLQIFLVENRVFSDSPILQFEHDRLQRTVGMRQQLVTSLTQTFEQARIDEVRNTPLITLIELPRVPALHDSKSRLLILLLGTMSGLALGTLAVLLKNSTEPPGGRRSADLEQLSLLWSETMADVRRLGRRPTTLPTPKPPA